MAPKEAQMAATSHTAAREGKTMEEIYQKKTQLEHILLRPDTYVGSIEAQQQDLWVFNAVQSRMEQRKIAFVPALYKIFDEILVNAADNLMRDPVGMDTIKVEIDAKAGMISVMNNGKGLPVVMHKEQKCYVPELVFGHLLTSDNYNDKDCKVVGGRNGYGAKLANVFSLEFTIETCDGKNKFVQTFRNNMTERGEPIVTPYTKATYTKVSFKPDLKKFGMAKLDDDIVALMTKRVYDIAGSTIEKCKVWFGGEQLDVKNFRDYTDLYLLTRTGYPQIYEKCSDRWEVCLSLSEAGFQQVSFCNSICTIRGGRHVDHVSDQIVEALLEKAKIASKEKVKGGLDIKAHHVKSHLWIFVKALIENPAFDGQTKETLTTKTNKFGSHCELSEHFIEQVVQCGVIDLILKAAEAKTKVKMGKELGAKTGTVKRLMGIPKLEDANDAGGKNSKDCTLILTEGDSAKALAVAGLSVIGRDRYGVFPLRGKVLNVRDATLHQMMSNAEIQNIIKIVGLNLETTYDEELKGLRYGHIMIMADQDFDGSHIKGLLINLVHAWWPSLAKLPGFVQEFFTPIIKAKKGNQRPLCFYTMPEYDIWKEGQKEEISKWKIKYYKGLGTSTAKEAKEYFNALATHKMTYKHDSEADDRAIDLAFNKKRADDRKDWINGYEDGQLVDHTNPEVSYSDFINKELVLFSKYNVTRAIPSVVDGFKPGQRKILFACIKRKLKKDVKVAQLVGYVAEKAAYHHGETSLGDTIVGMAQDFVGSNNINLLVPQGQFGTRLQGGKDSASTRYIYTRMADVTYALFHPDDTPLLDYQDEEGQCIEPTWYCPIIPIVLVNGAKGIGTGWSTSVPNFNPRDIIANVKRFIKGEELEPIHPWYNGFTGKIETSKEQGKMDVMGVVNYTGDKTSAKVTISELPLEKWTQDYREFLEECLPKGGNKNTTWLKDYAEFHTEKTVRFELEMSEEEAKLLENQKDAKRQDHLEKMLKLRTSISMNNMMLFNAQGKIHKYDSPLEIIYDFCIVRQGMYHKRKEYMLARLTFQAEELSAKARFIEMVCKKTLVVKKRKILDLIKDLRKKGFVARRDLKGSEGGAEADEGEDKDDGEDEEEDEEEGEGADGEEEANNEAALRRKGIKDFEYLVGMAISTLTKEKYDELMQQKEKKLKQRNDLDKKAPETLWLDDLADLEICLVARDDAYAKAERDERAKIEKARENQGKKSKAKAPGAKRAASEPAAKRAKTVEVPAAAKEAPAASAGRGQKRKPA